MSTKEQLLKEYTEWTVKYVKADERLKSLLPHVSEVSRGEEFQPFIPTEESLAEIANAEEDVNTARGKLREILDKLSELR